MKKIGFCLLCETEEERAKRIKREGALEELEPLLKRSTKLLPNIIAGAICADIAKRIAELKQEQQKLI